MINKFEPVALRKVSIEGGFWGPRQATNRYITLPIEYQQCKTTGRIDAWRLVWKPGQPNPPHHFWDSDVAKWIEAAAYTLGSGADLHPGAAADSQLETIVDEVIDLIAAAQQGDGYLNTHFTVVEPQNRWKNLRDMHELYCAGHLIEAAVAYCEATGKHKFLDVMCRYTDHIGSIFGPDEGQKRGYPGHPELELALVKLYRATGEGRYLQLAQFFVDERGQKPYYFDLEAQARGEQARPWWGKDYGYFQAHLPLREQQTAEGHAVRAMYLFSGAADVAGETGDETLLAACRRLWANVAGRRMYITGGLGSSEVGERFTMDYDLPNETAYTETCAAIGLVFWAHRMLHLDGQGAYADAMERALYNGVLSGVSLDGKRFFYANPLVVYPPAYAFRSKGVTTPTRQEWFDCACCPPNIARLLASLGQYVYSQNAEEAYVHLYVQSSAELKVSGQRVTLKQETDYPWGERVHLLVESQSPLEFTLALRIPGWCREAAVAVNGASLNVSSVSTKGYARIRRLWQPGDHVTLQLPMPVEIVETHPRVRMNVGRVALQRGPLVYCLEEVDNGPDLADIAVRRDTPFDAKMASDLLGGVTILIGVGERRAVQSWGEDLYRAEASPVEPWPIVAVPYYAWCNRKPGEMSVWLRQI
jgi:DUF1680 family protein